jgi:hypothetical protein
MAPPQGYVTERQDSLAMVGSLSKVNPSPPRQGVLQQASKKVKLSLQHAVEAHRVVRRRGSHILWW